MTPTALTTDELREVLDEVRQSRSDRAGDSRRSVPAWGQLTLAVLAVIVSLVLAWANMNTRISLIEQKLDYLVSHSGPLR